MKKLLALVLALVMTLGLATVGTNAALSDFSDADSISADYEEAMSVMNAVGVFVGSDGKLTPKENLTRAQAAKLVAYLDLGETVAEALPAVAAFDDVPATHWAAKYVAYCKDAGIINGVGGNKFDPDAQVTGYAFGKMMLCVLGYDADIEQYVGNGWQIRVATAMESNGINDDVDKAGSVGLTREEAAQFCLNSLMADTVAYESKGSKVTINGAEIITGASAAKPVESSAAYATALTNEKAANAAAANTLQLGEKLYKGDLKLNSNDTDDFGRPAETWTYKTTEVVTKSDAPDVTFTATTSAANVAKALSGYYLADAAGNKYAVNNITDRTFNTAAGMVSSVAYTDGAWTSGTAVLPVSAETTAKAIADETKNGKLVEIYADDDTNVITAIFETQYRVVKVSSVSTSSSSTTYTLETGVTAIDYVDTTVDDTIVFKTAPAKDDVVTYTKTGTTYYVYPTTSFTGTQSGYNTSSGVITTVTVDGTAYDRGTGVSNCGDLDSNKAGTFYQDQFGYVVYATIGSSASTDYAYIQSISGTIGGALDKKPSIEARVVLADGTVGVYEIAVAQAATGDGVVGTSALNAVLGTNIAKGNFAVGDWYIKGTEKGTTANPGPIMAVDIDQAASNTTANLNLDLAACFAATAANGKRMVWGYTLDGNVMTLERLTILPANTVATENNTVYTVNTGAVIDEKETSQTVNTDKTLLFDAKTKYVVYNQDKKTATVYTGPDALPESATGETGEAVLKTGTTNKVGTVSVVFIETASGLSADALDNYVYINSTKYTSNTVSGKTVKSYTAYTAAGEKLTLADPDSKVTSTGLFSYDPDELTVTKLRANNTTNVTNAAWATTYYAYDGKFSATDTQVQVGDEWYNLTDATQVYYDSSSLTKVDGNGGYAVRGEKNGAATREIVAIFVTTKGTDVVTLASDATNDAIETALGSGNVTISGGKTLTDSSSDNALAVPTGKTLTIDGDLTLDSAATTLDIKGDGAVVVTGNLYIKSSDGSVIQNSTGAKGTTVSSLTVNGNVYVETNESIEDDVELTVNKDVIYNVDAKTLTLKADAAITGNVTAKDNTVGGTFVVNDADADVSIGGGVVGLADGKIAVTVTNGNLVIADALPAENSVGAINVSNNSTLTVSSASVSTIEKAVTVDAGATLTTGPLTINSDGAVAVSGALVVNGALTVTNETDDATVVAKLTAASVSLAAGQTLNLTGVSAVAGAIASSGTGVLDNDGTLTVGSLSLAGGTLDNDGNLTVNGDFTTASVGTLTDSDLAVAGKTVTVNGDMTIEKAVNLAGALTVSGDLTAGANVTFGTNGKLKAASLSDFSKLVAGTTPTIATASVEIVDPISSAITIPALGATFTFDGAFTGTIAFTASSVKNRVIFAEAIDATAVFSALVVADHATNTQAGNQIIMKKAPTAVGTTGDLGAFYATYNAAAATTAASDVTLNTVYYLMGDKADTNNTVILTGSGATQPGFSLTTA